MRSGREDLVVSVGYVGVGLAFGLPIVLFGAHLPDLVRRGAEAAIGLLIVALALRLLLRWRRGFAMRRSALIPEAPSGCRPRCAAWRA